MLLREKLQSITEALAEMTADKSKEITKKWLNWIIFMFLTHSERLNLIFMKRPPGMENNHTALEILRYNLEKLNIKVYKSQSSPYKNLLVVRTFWPCWCI